MSRYAFDQVVTNAESLIDFEAKYDENGDEIDNTPIDTKGYSLNDWVAFGVVGWDAPLETYFIYLDCGGDMPSWWLGNSHKEIKTFEDLCQIINRIFSVQQDIFTYEDVIEIDD